MPRQPFDSLFELEDEEEPHIPKKHPYAPTSTKAESYLSFSPDSGQNDIIQFLKLEKQERNEGLTRPELSELLDKPTATISGLVTPLVEHGIIKVIGKRRNPKSGKNVEILSL